MVAMEMRQGKTATGTDTNESQLSQDKTGSHMTNMSTHGMIPRQQTQRLPSCTELHQRAIAYNQVRYGISPHDHAVKLSAEPMSAVKWVQPSYSLPVEYVVQQKTDWTFQNGSNFYSTGYHRNQTDMARCSGIHNLQEQSHSNSIERSTFVPVCDQNTPVVCSSSTAMQSKTFQYTEEPTTEECSRKHPIGPQTTKTPGVDTNNNRKSCKTDRQPANRHEKDSFERTAVKADKRNLDDDDDDGSAMWNVRRSNVSPYDNIQMLANMAVQRSEDSRYSNHGHSTIHDSEGLDTVVYVNGLKQKPNGKTVGCLVENIIQQTVQNGGNTGKNVASEAEDAVGNFQSSNPKSEKENIGSDSSVVNEQGVMSNDKRCASSLTADKIIKESEGSGLSRKESSNTAVVYKSKYRKWDSRRARKCLLPDESLDKASEECNTNYGNVYHGKLPDWKEQSEGDSRRDLIERSNLEKHLPAKKRRICRTVDISSNDYWMCTPRDASRDFSDKSATGSELESYENNGVDLQSDVAIGGNMSECSNTNASNSTLPWNHGYVPSCQKLIYHSKTQTYSEDSVPALFHSNTRKDHRTLQYIPAYKLGYNSTTDFLGQRPQPEPGILSFPYQYHPYQQMLPQQQSLASVPYQPHSWLSRGVPHSGYHGYVNSFAADHGHYKDGYLRESVTNQCKSGE